MAHSIYAFGHFFAAIVYSMLGGSIISKDFRSPLNQSCTAILACFAIWAIGFTGIHHPSASIATAQLSENIASIGWIWYSFVHLWFVWVYTRHPRIKHQLLYTGILLVIPLVLTLQQLFTGALVSSHLPRPYGWLSQWNLNSWTYLYFLYIAVVGAVGLFLLFDHRRTTDNPIVRRQSLILLVSGILTLLFGSLVNIIFPLLDISVIVPIADITTLIWAAGLAYTVGKYRMLDITPFVAAQRIITVMKDLLFLLDIRGTVMSVNPSALRSLGCSNEQLIGRPFIQLIDEPAEVRDRLNASILSLEAYSCETALALSDMPSLPVILSTSLLPGIGIVGVAHDNSMQHQRTATLHEAKRHLETKVTVAAEKLQATNRRLVEEISERKQAARTLMEAEQRFRAIFEHAPDGIFLCDTEGTIIDANKITQQITGYTKKALTGKNTISDGITPAEYHAPLRTLFNVDETTDQALTLEIEVINNEGARIPVEITSHAVRINDRRMILGIIRDLSQKKKSQHEAEELRRQFHHAQKLEAIGQLAGGIAHDFNNLLGGIIGYAGLLKKKVKNVLPEALPPLDKIIDVSRQAADRTTQLLAFARKGKYQVTSVDMHAVIDDVINLLEHTLDKKITLEKNYTAPCPQVSGDRSQLHGALLNLGINSRDALPDGGTISFTTEVVPPDRILSRISGDTTAAGSFLKITVADNGSGMDETTRNRAFEPFFTTKGQGKGSGLGLASTYGIVQNHNGCIDIQSEPGKGTTISLHLPLTDALTAEEETRPLQMSGMSGSSGEGTIIIVDDVAIVREMIEETLTEQGYTVHTFSDGRAALSWYETGHSDTNLVILDLTMPVMSGKECYIAMKALHPDLKAIITSGHAIDRETNDLLAHGEVTFLQKPFEIDDLVEAVRQALQPSR
ncbi:MAG: PAS domain S-box protein [Chitinispirillaceae bacterium]|nr:PAS domain S-box protein [Chitinispirillaceae bacterium]